MPTISARARWCSISVTGAGPRSIPICCGWPRSGTGRGSPRTHWRQGRTCGRTRRRPVARRRRPSPSAPCGSPTASIRAGSSESGRPSPIRASRRRPSRKWGAVRSPSAWGGSKRSGCCREASASSTLVGRTAVTESITARAATGPDNRRAAFQDCRVRHAARRRARQQGRRHRFALGPDTAPADGVTLAQYSADGSEVAGVPARSRRLPPAARRKPAEVACYGIGSPVGRARAGASPAGGILGARQQSRAESDRRGRGGCTARRRTHRPALGS